MTFICSSRSFASQKDKTSSLRLDLRESIEMLYEFEKAFGMKATPMKEAIEETVKWFTSRPEKK
jgi:hypothetical protein